MMQFFDHIINSPPCTWECLRRMNSMWWSIVHQVILYVNIPFQSYRYTGYDSGWVEKFLIFFDTFCFYLPKLFKAIRILQDFSLELTIWNFGMMGLFAIYWKKIPLYKSIWLDVSFYIYIYLSIYLYISIYLSIYISIYLTYLSLHLIIYLSIYPSIHIYLFRNHHLELRYDGPVRHLLEGAALPPTGKINQLEFCGVSHCQCGSTRCEI